MKRWIRFAARCYPRSWRAEFGEEFDALLEDVQPRWRVAADVLRGAIRMQMTLWTNWRKLLAATSAAGAIVAAVASIAVAPHFTSQAMMTVTPERDPVRPQPTVAMRQQAYARAVEITDEILSRSNLAQVINNPRLQLYRTELEREPFEDVIAQMRHDVRIDVLRAADGDDRPVTIRIAFSYPDPVKAKETVSELAAGFTDANRVRNNFRKNAYLGFWHDMEALGQSATAPEPPAGQSVAFIQQWSPPDEAGKRRLVYVAWGIAGGLILGLFAAFAVRWPRETRRMCAYAVAGFLVAAALSELLPNRFVSTGAMMISPPAITEDPGAPLPPTTSATEFLRATVPVVLSDEELARIIRDPRLNLYPEARASKPMEDVVEKMVAKDLRISAAATSEAFTISFEYPDRIKAQRTVQALMNLFDSEMLERQRESARNASATFRQIVQRKFGEHLLVLDVASLPVSPVWPNRLAIGILGMAAGVLLCSLRMHLQRPPASGPMAAAAPAA